MGFALTKDNHRAPSPLNGERAGVRGEWETGMHCKREVIPDRPVPAQTHRVRGKRLAADRT